MLVFKHAEGKEFEQGHSAGERFGYVLHQVKLLRAGEQPFTGFSPVAVDPHFQVGQDLREILHLIKDDRALAETVEESLRVAAAEPPFDGIVKTDIGGILPRFVEDKRGLARLPGAGNQDRRKLLHGLRQRRMQQTPDIHLTIIKFLFIIVKIAETYRNRCALRGDEKRGLQSKGLTPALD